MKTTISELTKLLSRVITLIVIVVVVTLTPP
jgi:hypothetical protein